MAALRRLPSLGGMVAEFGKTALRFPLPVACALGFALVSLADNHGLDLFAAPDEGGRLRILLVLGFFATLAAGLFAEQRRMPRPLSIPLALGALALIALRVYSAPHREDDWFEGPLLFLGPAVVLLAVAGRFIANPRDSDGFWEFNRASWQGAAFAFLIAAVLALGLSAALAAVDTLFAVAISGRPFEDIWVLCLSLLWPWQALAVVPLERAAPEAPNCPKLLARLISHILVPLALIYLAIIYAYGAKMLFARALPEGEVASLVAGYAAFGVAVHLIAYPLRETGPRLVALFHRWFYPALVGPVALLALAVWLRVSAYGVTEQRYMLALFALWLAGTTLWFWRRPARSLVLVPLSLALLLGAASFGPWGAIGLSTASQMARLEALLIKHDLLRDQRIVPAGAAVDWDDQKAISSIVEYLRKTGKLERLRPWFAADPALDASADSRTIMSAMGLTYVPAWRHRSYFNYTQESDEGFPVAGFDTLVDWTAWHGLKRRGTVQTDSRRYEIALEEATKTLSVRDDLGRSVSFDLAGLARRLKDREDGGDLAEHMTLEKTARDLRVRLRVVVLGGQMIGDDPEVSSFGGFILIGEAAE